MFSVETADGNPKQGTQLHGPTSETSEDSYDLFAVYELGSAVSSPLPRILQTTSTDRTGHQAPIANVK